MATLYRFTDSLNPNKIGEKMMSINRTRLEFSQNEFQFISDESIIELLEFQLDLKLLSTCNSHYFEETGSSLWPDEEDNQNYTTLQSRV